MIEFVISNVLRLSITTIIAKVESNISTENNNLIWFAILSIVEIVISYYSTIVADAFSTKVQLDFERKQLEKYDGMDRKSKEKSTIEVFNEKVNRAKNVMATRYSWGLSAILNLISTLVVFFAIIVQHKQYFLLLCFTVVHIGWYFLVTKTMMNKIDEQRKELRNERSTRFDIIHLLTTQFHAGQCDVNTIMNKKTELEDLFREMNKLWARTMNCQRLPNFIVILIAAYFSDKSMFVILYIVCNNVNNSISNFLQFMNQYKTHESDLKDLNDFWEGKTFDHVCEQQYIPSIMSFYAAINNVVSVMYTKPLYIKQGEKILVSGKSGSGKTTLVRGLLGYETGLTFDSGQNPLSYSDAVKYMSQNIKDFVPTVRTTIRQLFYDEQNNDSILEALRIVQLEEWFSDTINGNLDQKIESKISGGQKTRLCLAIVLYKAIKEHAQWIILDEPDAGLDPELSPELLKNVLDAFPMTTIFIIVHLCKCQIPKLGIKKEWHVSGGTVSEYLYS